MDNYGTARPEQADERRCLLVLGMHRSGTSALTRVLSLLGADLPATLMPPASDNEAGFWEPGPLVDYHDRLLGESGSDWDDWRALDPGRIPAARRNQIKREIAGLIEEEYGASRCFVLKDPRICRFLPLYAELLSERRIDPSYVISLRNPLAVAASLTARNGLTMGFACLVWLGHILEAERATRGTRRVFVDYERLLSNWRGVVADIGLHLQFVWPNSPESVAADIEKFLSRGLQHHAPSDGELEAHPEVARWVKDAYAALLQLQKNPTARAALRVLDVIRAEFEAVAPVFGEAVFKELAARDVRLRAIDQARAIEQGEINVLKSTLAAEQGEINVLKSTLAARDHEIALLHSTAAAFRASTSWRIIESLRACMRWPRRVAFKILEYREILMWRQMKPPDSATLHDWRVVGAIIRSGVFDQAWYLNNNPDVAAAGINPIRHYLSHGAREGRDPSPVFSTHDYLIRNPDVAAAGINPLVHFVLYGVAEGRDRSGIMMSALSHRRSRLQLQVRQSIVRMTLWNRMSFKTQNRLRHLVHRLLPQHVFDYLFPRGFTSKEVTRKIEIDYSVAVPFGYHPLVSVDRIKLAVICHIYFEGLAVEIQRYLRNIPFPFDVFISTDTPAKQEKLQTLFADWNIGSVEIRLVANRGRDIAPKLIGFRDVYDRYEYVLHLYTKSSEHGGVLKHWRGFLLENLVGSRDLVESIFAAFIRHQDLGIIGSQHFEPVRHVVNWGGNFECAEQLAARMGIALSIDKVLDFPAGSMFWARSAALRPLLDLNLSLRDFPRETGQIDGTLAHAIERLYYFVCEKAGFTWIKVARPELFDHTPAITTIGSPEALDRYMAEKTLKLTGPVLPEQRREPLPGLAECSRGLINRRQASALGSDLSVDTTVRLTIGIVTYENTSLQIRRIVASARQALTQAGLERNALILMIDNGTSTEPFLAAHDGVRYLPSEGNIGFAAGQNRLMTAAFAKGTDIYIAANPDGIFHPNAIKSIVQMMQAQNNHSLIEAIQFPLEHPKEFNPTTFETPWASAACLAIPREIFRKIGGFDEALFMYCEDVDLSWRARASGFAVHICPRAIFLHPVTNRPRDPAVLRMMFNSGVILARKWGNRTFERGLKEELHRLGFQLPHIHPDPVPPNWRHIADFSHRFSFAETRW